MEYKLIDRTPKETPCAIGACPKIYEIECVGAACPAVAEMDTKHYGIIGKIVDLNSEEARTQLDDGKTLASKVGKGEVLIKVPKGLIDEMRWES